MDLDFSVNVSVFGNSVGDGPLINTHNTITEMQTSRVLSKRMKETLWLLLCSAAIESLITTTANA
jgi:hypothetical protein